MFCFACTRLTQWVDHPRATRDEWLQIYESVIIPSSSVLRTELSIFSCSLRLAGQIDCICRDRAGKLVIWDGVGGH